MDGAVRSSQCLCYTGLLFGFLSLCEGWGWTEIVYPGESLGTMTAAPQTVPLTEQDNGRQVSIPVGTQIVLRLEAVPGTGYGWQMVGKASPQLQLEGAPVFESKSQEEAGGPEDEVFHFRAQVPGEVDLEFHYRRPWEKEIPSTRRFSFHVIVE